MFGKESVLYSLSYNMSKWSNIWFKMIWLQSKTSLWIFHQWTIFVSEISSYLKYYTFCGMCLDYVWWRLFNRRNEKAIKTSYREFNTNNLRTDLYLEKRFWNHQNPVCKRAKNKNYSWIGAFGVQETFVSSKKNQINLTLDNDRKCPILGSLILFS